MFLKVDDVGAKRMCSGRLFQVPGCRVVVLITYNGMSLSTYRYVHRINSSPRPNALVPCLQLALKSSFSGFRFKRKHTRKHMESYS